MALLEGKTAVITGGNSGIGLATAKRFAKRAQRLDHRPEAGGTREGGQGNRPQGHRCPGRRLQASGSRPAVRHSRRQRSAHRRGVRQCGRSKVARLGEITEEHFDHRRDVDVKGVVFTVQKALPLFNDGGSVILNSSNTNAKASDGIGVYAAIKAALRSLARTWASELRDRRIRVNVVSPGATETPGIEGLPRMLFPGPRAAAKFEEFQIGSVPIAHSAPPTRWPTRCCFWHRTSAASPPAPTSPSTEASTRSKSRHVNRAKLYSSRLPARCWNTDSAKIQYNTLRMLSSL